MHKHNAFDASRYFVIKLAAYYISRHNIDHYQGQQTIVWLNLIQQVYGSGYQLLITKVVPIKLKKKLKVLKHSIRCLVHQIHSKKQSEEMQGVFINNNNTHNWYLFKKKKDRLIFKFSDSKQWVITEIWPSIVSYQSNCEICKACWSHLVWKG